MKSHARTEAVAGSEGLRRVFAGIEASRDCRVGVCARGLEGPLSGYEVGTGEDRVFESASLIKVLVLAELLRQADAGEVSLHDRLSVGEEEVVEYSDMVQRERAAGSITVERLAWGMVSESDNTATNLLIPLSGKDRINDRAKELRLKHTVLARKMMDFEARARGEHNLTSASDMVALLAATWEGRFLSPASRDLALRILEGQKLTSNVSGALPPGGRFAHKTGELEGTEHDAGIVILPRRSFALAILAQGDLDSAKAPVRLVVSRIHELFSGTAA